MLRTFEAITDDNGHIRVLEPVELPAGWRVLITILSGPDNRLTTRLSPSVSVMDGDFQTAPTTGAGLVEFFRSSPLAGIELDLERDSETAREVML